MATPASSRATSIIYEWPEQGEWTYENYARLPDDGRRYEVIRGRLHATPAASTKHQLVSFELAFALYDHLTSSHG